MVAVGMLLGVAASAGSNPWVGSIGYMVGLLGGHVIGAAGGHDPRAGGGWFMLGLAFTSGVVLSCTVVLGTQVGRSVAGRRIAATVASLAAVGIALS